MPDSPLGDIQKVDMGIALAHFDLTMKENKTEGCFVIKDPGFVLKPKAEELTLFQIYQAVNEAERVRLFDLHQNPNDQCIVGRHIEPVLTELFVEMEEAAALALSGKTLDDCIGGIRKCLDSTDRCPVEKVKENELFPSF